MYVYKYIDIYIYIIFVRDRFWTLRWTAREAVFYDFGCPLRWNRPGEFLGRYVATSRFGYSNRELLALQMCHLMESWMSALEYIVEGVYVFKDNIDAYIYICIWWRLFCISRTTLNKSGPVEQERAEVHEWIDSLINQLINQSTISSIVWTINQCMN